MSDVGKQVNGDMKCNTLGIERGRVSVIDWMMDSGVK